ncbi:unnamed protein product [Ixodes hexagonus]
MQPPHLPCFPPPFLFPLRRRPPLPKIPTLPVVLPCLLLLSPALL